MQGLKVALVEKVDFCHGTSGHHFKMAHGGIRYLQHADIVRTRESSHERSALLRIAPHLVRPMPILIPTYGNGKKSKLLLRTGALVYDLLTFDRNQGLQIENRIPNARSISRNKILSLFPGIARDGLTGGVCFCDGQIYNPPRLIISVLRTAAAYGAVVANYSPVTKFRRKGNRVTGLVIRDKLENKDVCINSRYVLNAAGPWAARLLKEETGIRLNHPPTFSRDLAFVVNRKPSNDFALAFATQAKDSDSLLDRGGRHLFCVPWRGYTLFGVWHKVHNKTPEEIQVTKEELTAFVAELNDGYPGLNLQFEEIMMVNTGLTLYGDESEQKNEDMSFGKRSLLIDHKKDHGIEGIATLIGVRATMGRKMAETAIRHIVRKLGKRTNDTVNTAETTIYGGDFTLWKTLCHQAADRIEGRTNDAKLDALLRNYGSGYGNVLQYAEDRNELFDELNGSAVMGAEVIHAVREEMAKTLGDVVFRRTDLGTGGGITPQAVNACADLMAQELGWTETQRDLEISRIEGNLPSYCRQRFFSE